MSLERPHHGTDGVSNGGPGVRELVRCILGRFNQVSINRIHKISFITEYRYKKRGGDRITSARYYRVMDGCRSDAISEVINNLNSITRKEVVIAGETINTIIPDDEIICNPDVDDCELFETVADNVVRTYGDIPPNEINAELEEIPEYRKTRLGENIRF